MGDDNATTNRAQRRAVKANARTGKPKDYRKAFDGTPTSSPLDSAALASITLVWLPDLALALGRSRSTIEKWVRERRFPPPLKITEQGCCWRVATVEAWLDKVTRQRKRVVHRGAVAKQMKKAGRDA